MLKLEHVKKYYRVPALINGKTRSIAKNRRVILDDINLEIKKGDIVAVTGKSGCGKSTLLNVIAGLTPPSQGKVYFNDRRMFYFLDFMPAIIRNLRIGFIFQTFQLLNNETVRQNVLLPAMVNGSVGRKTFKHMDELLDKLGILEYKKTRVGTLSGGQKQRVAIARALINDPYLVMADEPTANLDQQTSHEIFDILEELAKKQDKAILIVTHKDYMLERAGRIFGIENAKLKEMQ